MKTCLPITILLALLLATTASAAQVGSIGLTHQSSGTVVRIDVQGPFQFTHTTEVPKDGKPDRLIVDIVGATHTWGPKEWSSLPVCGVSKVRIGQYSSKPEKVVRVVFELSKAPVYQAESDGKSISIRLTDASIKPFAAWSTGPAPTAAPVVPTPAPAAPALANTQPAVKSNPTTPVVKPATTSPSNAPAVASAPKVESKPAAQPTPHAALAQKPAVTQPSPQATTSAKAPAVTAQTPATSSPKPTTPVVAPTNTSPKPVVATQPTSKPAPVVASNEVKPNSTTAPVVKPSTAAPNASAKVETKPAPVVAQQTPAPAVSKPVPTTEVKPASPTVAQATPKVETKVAAPEGKSPTPSVAAKPDQLAKAEQFKSPVATNAPAEKAAPTTVAPAVKPNSPVVATATPTTAKPADTPADSKSEVKATTPTVTLAKNDADNKALDKAADAKSANPDQAKAGNVESKVKGPEKPMLAEVDDATGISTPARQTARFRRSATASAKMKSSLVAEFPQRLVIKYENMGYRDPFATLIDDTRTYDTPIEKRLANVEGLRLVGILESGSGNNSALFQDKRNFSYMLKAGDKVEKGYVLRVESDKVYFQIFEYGWSRTVALTFDNRD